MKLQIFITNFKVMWQTVISNFSKVLIWIILELRLLMTKKLMVYLEKSSQGCFDVLHLSYAYFMLIFLKVEFRKQHTDLFSRKWSNRVNEEHIDMLERQQQWTCVGPHHIKWAVVSLCRPGERISERSERTHQGSYSLYHGQKGRKARNHH